MSVEVKAYEHQIWKDAGLEDYGSFADKIEEYNQRDIGGGDTAGQWYYIPDEHVTDHHGVPHKVIYLGSWGNYNSPGADEYTSANLYEVGNEDDMKEFEENAKTVKAYPEWIPQEEEEPEEDLTAETLAERADAKGMTYLDIAKICEIPHDRIHTKTNFGIINQALEEGDTADWLEEVIEEFGN